MDRRTFVKKGLASLFIASGATETASFLNFVLPSAVDKTDSSPVKDFAGGKKADEYPYETLDFEVDGTRFKMYGVQHTREFAAEWGEFFGGVVSKSSAVVLEASPFQLESPNIMPTGKAFFGTLADMCKRHGKNWIYIDPQAPSGDLDSIILGDFIVSGLAPPIAFLSGVLLKVVSEYSRGDEKDIGKVALIGLVSSYLGLSSYMSGMQLRYYLTGLKHEELFYNGIVDYRNARIASGLIKVPEVLDDSEKKGGEYVAVFYGGGHVDGVKKYLENGILREAKLASYKPTFDLFDNDYMLKLGFDGKQWTELKRLEIE